MSFSVQNQAHLLPPKNLNDAKSLYCRISECQEVVLEVVVVEVKQEVVVVVSLEVERPAISMKMETPKTTPQR